MIETRDLCKEFRDRKRGAVRAVDGVSIVCRPGEIFGLLGANGAGKTTTLRLLATLLKPTSGSASVGGKDVATESEAVRARIGFLSTATALYGRLTPREVIRYFARLHGLTEARVLERTENLVERLGMREFADRRCDKLSTGMKQRTSIARSLVHDPPVMIFDEPTTGLDVMGARGILSFIRECRSAGKTVILSTHVMREVEKLCDRVAVIHQGRIVESGTLSELRARFGEEDLEEIFVLATGGAAW